MKQLCDRSLTVKQLLILFVLSVLFVTEAYCQDAEEEQLMQYTSSVGQMLYSYYSAFDVAVQTINSQAGSTNLPKLFAGGPYDGGWAFSFGDFEENGEFVITYGVIVDPDGNVVNFDHFDFRRVASPHHSLAAQALLSVMNDFEEFRNENDQIEAEVFRYAVLPFPRDYLTAFVSPKQYCENSTLIGNDMMYRLVRSDSEIVHRNRFIHSLLMFPQDLPENHVASVIKVPQNPMPSPLDVLVAMERGEKFAVFAARGVFMIEPNGTIEKLPDDDPLIEYLRDSI
jgi:hypothetical protein